VRSAVLSHASTQTQLLPLLPRPLSLLSEITPFDVPRTLKVGTLDSLMSLSDEVARADAFVEGVAKKVERQVAEAYFAEKALEVAKAGGDSVVTPSVGPLRMYVPGGPSGKPIPVHEWAAAFKWDAGAWGDSQDSLQDILRRLLAAGEKIDVDIRAYSQSYQERKSALQAAERKKR
jgi:V-type H+-transporting ATPase subunit C